MSGTVTVTMPFWGAHRWIRRAVDSILEQTYRDVRLVVVNDADPVPPWSLLEDIDDPRLVRFDLPENRGRYFADAVILAACDTPWFAMQDPDDWADPERFEVLVPLAERAGGAAFGASTNHRNGRAVRDAYRLEAWPVPGHILHMVGYGSGVIATSRIREVGGYHADLRVGYDTWLHNAVRLMGGWETDARSLQHKLFRAGSLTSSPETGMRTPYRDAVRERLDGLWRAAWRLHRAGRSFAHVIRSDVEDATWAEVEEHAARLRALLERSAVAA